MKQRGKCLLSLALAFVMVLGFLPAQALAAYEGMSLEEEVTALYGQEGAEYYTFLEENKLLKEDELITDAEIEYNGKSYSAEEMRALLNEHQTSNSWKNHMNDNTCNLNIWRDIDEPAELKNAIFDGSISHVVANWEYSGDGEFTINAQNRDSEGIEADGSDSFLNNLNTKTDGYELTSQYKIIDPTRFPVGNDGSTSIAIRKQLTQENWDNIYIRSRGICFLDTTSPTITNLSAPGGNYKTGDIIPITLAFSESVRLNELTITINDSTTPLTAVTNGTDDTGAYATFLYPVGLGDSESNF